MALKAAAARTLGSLTRRSALLRFPVLVSLLALSTGAVLLGPGAASAKATTFVASASEQTYIVPAGVTSVSVVAHGTFGYAGGKGASVSAELPVTPGEILHVEVPGSYGGFDGSGGRYGSGSTASQGGGASDVRTVCEPAVSVGCTASSAASLASRLVVAGGGGGEGAGAPGASGVGGNGAGGTAFFPVSGGSGEAGTNGADGVAGNGTGGSAGTGTAGGAGGSGCCPQGSGDGDAGDGGRGAGGFGGTHSGSGVYGGGGGGGGYLGGGGGGGAGSTTDAGGGGGGSSFVSAQASGATFALDGSYTPGLQITPGRADTTPPTISISTPGEGAHYAQGQVVHTSYSCSDPDDTFAVSCVGTVRSGAAVDTGAAGAKSFTVNATDHAGNSARRTVHYIVDARCVVPKLKGKKLKAAKKALKKAHCSLGKVRPKGKKSGKVKKQKPKPGKVLPAGSKVNIKLG